MRSDRGSTWKLRLLRVWVVGLSGLAWLTTGSALGADPVADGPTRSSTKRKASVQRTKRPVKNLSQLHQGFRSSCTQPNASYLSSVEDRFRTPDGVEQLWGSLAGDQVSQLSVSRWGATLREREQRAQQGLWSRDQDYLFHSRMASEGGAALVEDFKSAQQQRRAAELQAASERIQKQNPEAAVPLQVIAVAATVTTGQPITAKVGDSSRIVARTNVPARQAQLKVETPWVESDLKVIGRDVLNANEERYRLELSRGIPLLRAQGSVGYGGSSTLVTTSVKTQLSPSWLCVVDSSRPLDRNRAGGIGDDRIRFEYGIRF